MSIKVLAVVDDLFFASKIRGTAEALDVPVGFPRALESLIQSAKTEPPALIICDLNATRIDPITLSERLKADDGLRSVPLIGFFSHVDTELQRRAIEAGFDRVMPRSAFTSKLPQIIQDLRECAERTQA
jgi:CheY-like chemotaxis protein